MMKLSQVAEVLLQQTLPQDIDVQAVSTDTRMIQPGDLFIALRGETFDAADFIDQARQAGAVAAVVNADSYQACEQVLHTGWPVLFVADTRLALGQLAAWWRSQFQVPLVALTGSNGKTTVKEMLAGILRVAAGSDEAVLATKGNLNNDIGMPLTLLRLRAHHRYVVLEMGMNHEGEIEYLSDIANPDIALVNNASAAHLQGLGSVEAVAHAKGEIFSGLRDNGTAIINADDAYAGLWEGLAGTHSLLEFGMQHEDVDVTAQWQSEIARAQLQLQTPHGDLQVELKVPGQHNVYNALAATSVAVVLNIPLEMIAQGLLQFTGVHGRLQHKPGLNGALVIDDAYNANPASFKAAIDVLAQRQGQRILVLGDMGELGEGAGALHAQVGAMAQQAGIQQLYALGELSRRAVEQFGEGGCHFGTLDALQQALQSRLNAQTTVLIKGSRFMKMEKVVQFCTQG